MNGEQMLRAAHRHTVASMLVLALLWGERAQAQGTATGAAATSSTTSSVGLLPVHAISVDLAALPGVTDKGRGKVEETAALQQLWDAFLRGGGFNVIEFEVDVRDLGDAGAGRLARMCEWAKRNNVRIAPTLIGAAEGEPLTAEYATHAASLVGKVIATLGAAGLPAYSQIVFYRLERPLNQPAHHGAMEAEAATAILKAAAENVRAAELAGLASSGVQATPLLIPSSFDYELIRRGAIAQTPITDESYTQGYAGLRDHLMTVFGAAPVEAASVEWYPGSLSSEGVDRLPDLINRLQADLPGKLLIIDTGYSTAAGSDTAQARYYQVALTNMCDLRANQGVDSPFAGILWRSAVDSGTGERTAAVKRPEAGDVAGMMNDPKAGSREARSWFRDVRSQFGLLSRARSGGAGLAPKTAYRVMSALESSLAQSPQASDALAAVKELGEAAQSGGLGQAVKSRLQNALFGMLDSWLTKTADDLFTEPQEAGGSGLPPIAPQSPDIQIVGIGALPAKVTAGQSVMVPVTLFNAGSGGASDVAVYLRDGKPTDLARTNPLTLPPGGQASVELSWKPGVAGLLQGIAVEAFCGNDSDPSSNVVALGNLQVDAGPKPPPKSHILEAALSTSATRTMLQSSSTPSSSPPAPGSGSSGGNRTMMSTSSALGFATIEGLTAPSVMMAAAPASPPSPGGASSTRSITAAPAPAAASAPEPVTMTLANPFQTLFRDVVATLRIDDAVVSTRQLGSLLPGQRRTVTFTEWSPPRPGTYRLRTDLVGAGPAGKPLTSSATSTITVGAPASAARSAPSPASSPASPVRSLTATRSFAPLVRPVSSQPVAAFGAGTRTLGGSPGVRSFAAKQAVALTPNSILMRPFPPAPGTPASVTVQLSNPDRTPIHGARVAVSVDGVALGESMVDIPAHGLAMASGFKEWTATAGPHEVRAAVSVGASRSEVSKPLLVSAAGTRGFGRPAVVAGGAFKPGAPRGIGSPDSAGKPGFTMQPGFKPVMGGLRGGPGPNLQITPADIRFTPAQPAAGAAMSVAITVRNVGVAPANDGRVLAVLSAGGAEVARQQFAAAVPAKGLLTLDWPLTAPAASPLVVTVTATASGDTDPSNNQTRATVVGKPPMRAIPPRSTVGTIR